MRREVGRVRAVLIGQTRPYARGSASAIAKAPVEGPIRLHREGLAGDEQGDRRVHGGVDKAAHFYSFEHYARWRDELGALALLDAPGAFGENFSTEGVSEVDVCIGDRLQIGSAVLEVTQSRQPCWKLNDRFGVPDMARRLQDTSRTGWYCRVVETGEARAGDAIELLARPHPDWPLQRLIELLYRRPLDRALLMQARDLPLVESWQRLIENRLARGQVEDWSRRIEG